MPQVTLEYTANIPQEIHARDLFSGLHQTIADVLGISVNNCKSRALRLDAYHIGKGEAQNAFVHLDVRFLAGRPLDVKQEVGQQCLSLLRAYFEPSLAALELQITVEVRDVQRQTYFKIPEGTFKRTHDAPSGGR
jgi:5-carboxymethyl-2-hydroxymuconate isomerase